MSDRTMQLNLNISEAIVVAQIFGAVARAEKKHPEFVKTPEEAVSVLGEEFGEFAQAINDKDFAKAQNEALDIIAVCVRVLKTGWKNKNKDFVTADELSAYRIWKKQGDKNEN